MYAEIRNKEGKLICRKRFSQKKAAAMQQWISREFYGMDIKVSFIF